MHILVTGAAGMLGAKLISRLVAKGSVAGRDISKITRFDAVIPPPPPVTTFPIDTFVGDLADETQTASLIKDQPDVIFHLAAVVSGEAEANFEKGYRTNFDAVRALLERIRTASSSSYRPKFVFTSSIAVFGAPFPDKIGDEFFAQPLTSYGAQKAMGELLVSDYSRRGFIDGVSLRMPTVCVRPGRPNLAASGFFSNIIREPLVGQTAILPVADTVRHWHVSPRSAIGFLVKAANMDLSVLGNRRTLNMPGLSCTVAEQIEALRRAAGDKAVALIKNEPDETIQKIVSGWPRDFSTPRALELGFTAEKTFDEIIAVHIADELSKTA